MAANYVRTQPLASLQLKRHPFSSSGSILEISEATSSKIEVSDPTGNPGKPVTRFDLKTNRFVLLYTTAPDRSSCTIEINGDSPEWTVRYDFLDRSFAFEFQKYVTGYDPGQYEVTEKIQCDASIKKEGWRPGCDRYSGIGEIQLWVPFYGSSDENGTSTQWDTASAMSAATTSTVPAPRLVPQPHSTRSRSVFAFVNEGRSPLIMMFLRDMDSKTGAYTGKLTMLRLNLRKVHWTLGGTETMETLSFSQPPTNSHPHDNDKPFRAYRCSVPEGDTRKWDACAMARNLGSKGIEEITIMKLALKILRDQPPNSLPAGTHESLSRLGQLAQQLDELRKIIDTAQKTAQDIKVDIAKGRIPNQSLQAGAGLSSGASTHTLLSRRTSAASPSELSTNPSSSVQPLAQASGAHQSGTTSRTNPRRVPVGNHRPIPSFEGTSTLTSIPNSIRSPSSQAHHPHTGNPLSRHPSPYPASATPSTVRGSWIQPLGDIVTTAAYHPQAHDGIARSELPGTVVEEPISRLDENLDAASADSSDDEDAASFFNEFDDRVRRALHVDPSTRSAHAENTIRRLHTLPGELRALVYNFPAFTFEGLPERSDAGDTGSLASRSVTSSNPSGKLFRCPFNVANPQAHARGGCKGPGFPLSRLGDHLERRHLLHECPQCGKDCLNGEGLYRHQCNMEQTQRPTAAVPPGTSGKITLLKLWKIKEMLRPSRRGNIWDEQRWFQMWEELFPGVEQPEPYFGPRTEMEVSGFSRLEVVFDAMMEADGGGAVITKANTKLYLRAAMQAVEDGGLGRWLG
ncbi:hypothetical protein QBC39DRAFT_364116 [Podospora conica]|nr:hypothetical protein QBC39DRAFT_364116 [Schizothecium conicum]